MPTPRNRNKLGSRGRLLRIGAGRHAKRFGNGDPKSAVYPSDSDSDSNCSDDDHHEHHDDDDGTISPVLWSDDFLSTPWMKGKSFEAPLDISDDESGDEYDIDYRLPRVTDMLLRPYMINQVMTSDAVRNLGIGDVMDTGAVNVSMFDKRTRYLISVESKDSRGRKVTYAQGDDGGKLYWKTLGRWVTSCRSMLVGRVNTSKLSEMESIAIARGHFCLMVLRRWHNFSWKQASFRRIVCRFFCHQGMRHWINTTIFLRRADKFCGAILKAFYWRAFVKMNSQRLASKAADIMQLRIGNALLVSFRAWVGYLTLEIREKKRCEEFANHHLKKRVVKKWQHEVEVKKIFARAMGRVRGLKVAAGFEKWKTMSDWIGFTDKFWGTAVESAVKKSYLRWACQRWWSTAAARRKLRKFMEIIGEIGMLRKRDGDEVCVCARARVKFCLLLSMSACGSIHSHIYIKLFKRFSTFFVGRPAHVGLQEIIKFKNLHETFTEKTRKSTKVAGTRVLHMRIRAYARRALSMQLRAPFSKKNEKFS